MRKHSLRRECALCKNIPRLGTAYKNISRLINSAKMLSRGKSRKSAKYSISTIRNFTDKFLFDVPWSGKYLNNGLEDGGGWGWGGASSMSGLKCCVASHHRCCWFRPSHANHVHQTRLKKIGVIPL